MYYFDNAATSWPKPPAVARAMAEAVEEYGANPGRGSHRMAMRASRVIYETRENLARLCAVSNPNDIAFTLNTTMALNLAIKGWVRPGDHIICTNVEHNAVWRPLNHIMKERGATVSYVESSANGEVDLKELESKFQPRTRLVIVNHSSNLLGSILPVADIAEMARRRGAAVLVDAAQTIGILPIDVGRMGIDMLAFPGHKGLMGPQGTGGLYISPHLELEPLLHGGTGSQSDQGEQPMVRPDRYESGTLNTPGLAGLNEGVKFVLQETVENIHRKEWELSQRLMEGLMAIRGLTVLGPAWGLPRTGVVSFVLEGTDASEIAFLLDQRYGIAVRAGFHCTPLAHAAAGTKETGAVRASIGYFTTEDQVDYLVSAMKEIAAQVR